MKSEDKLWVLVYRRQESFEVAVQNYWGNRVKDDVMVHCQQLATEFCTETLGEEAINLVRRAADDIQQAPAGTETLSP